LCEQILGDAFLQRKPNYRGGVKNPFRLLELGRCVVDEINKLLDDPNLFSDSPEAQLRDAALDPPGTGT
jgi:hypothetical protein